MVGRVAPRAPRLPFTFLHWPELTRAFWIGHPEGAEQLWELVEEDLGHGQKLYLPDLDADNLARRAAGLMRNYCPRWKKLRPLDAMQVSAAVTGHFKTFVSFDTSSWQRVLAHTQKLSIWPPLTPGKRPTSSSCALRCQSSRSTPFWKSLIFRRTNLLS